MGVFCCFTCLPLAAAAAKEEIFFACFNGLPFVLLARILLVIGTVTELSPRSSPLIMRLTLPNKANLPLREIDRLMGQVWGTNLARPPSSRTNCRLNCKVDNALPASASSASMLGQWTTGCNIPPPPPLPDDDEESEAAAAEEEVAPEVSGTGKLGTCVKNTLSFEIFCANDATIVAVGSNGSAPPFLLSFLSSLLLERLFLATIPWRLRTDIVTSIVLLLSSISALESAQGLE
mmetsp:Transcript_14125/g.24817  ORF Transcript_14125/g.24817 Transcript_14125/m.24817 type:complete len:234 (+) Transcript_14125:3126-3827(+)